MSATKTSYLSDDHKDFTVSDREMIMIILQGLASKHVTLSGSFNAGSEILLTEVLGISQEENALYLDVNADEERNQQFARSQRTIFYSFSDGVKVQWTTTEIERGEFEGYKAFRIAIPEVLQRIQRRGSYRVATPITNPTICRIQLAPGREVVLPLVDICAEGIGVVMPATPEPEFQKNAEFKNCTLEHEDIGVIPVPLTFRTFWESTLANGNKSQRAGLEFGDMPSKTQSAIQRYVYKLDRLLIATSTKKRR
jgi:c-di-GMP-binding flagellar brake protein YcgR